MARKLFLLVLSLATLGLLAPPQLSAQESETDSDALHVASVSPEDRSDTVDAANARIVVTFDRPVVPLGLNRAAADPVPIIIEPETQGRGEWLNTSIFMMTFPMRGLAGGTSYTVTVPAGLTAADGTTLAEPYQWTFHTLPPQVLSITATDEWGGNYPRVLLESGFRVRFSQAMDHASTEAAFTMGAYGSSSEWYGPDDDFAPIEGRFEWNDDNTGMTFRPSALLLPNYVYGARLDASARSSEGYAALADPTDEAFWTVQLPTVAKTTPVGNSRIPPGRQSITFEFNTKMNTASYEDHYTITPEPEGEVVPYVADDGDLTLVFDHEADTAYTVTLLAGIEDAYGNRMEEDYAISYIAREGDVRTSVRAIVPSDFVIAGTYRDEAVLRLAVTGKPTVSFDLYRTDIEAVADMDYQWGMRYGGLFMPQYYADGREGPPPEIAWRTPENLLRHWSETYEQTTDDSSEEFRVPLALADGTALPPGLYGVELTSPGAICCGASGKTGFLLAVTSAAINVRRAPDGLLVWVTDLATAEPIADTNIAVRQAGEIVFSGRTDDHGVLLTPDDAISSRSQIFITAERDDVYAVWYSGTAGTLPTTAGYLYTDRPIYRPGETVYFRGIVRDRDDVDYTVPNLDGVYVRAGISQYYGPSFDERFANIDTPLYLEQLPLSDYGTYSGTFNIPDDLAPGFYQLVVSPCEPDVTDCSINGYRDGVTFEVAEFRVPEVEVKATPERAEIVAGDPLNVLVSANYYFGGSVDESAVVWSVRGYVYDSRFTYRGDERGFQFSDEPHSESAEIEGRGRTDGSGNFLIDVPLSREGILPINVSVDATVTDDTGQAISTRTNVLVHPADVYVGLRASDTFGFTGQTYTIDVLTVAPDSSPRPNQQVTLEITEIEWIRTPLSFGRYQWDLQETVFGITQVTTDADGKTQYAFDPPRAGIFRIRARTQDAQGRTAGSAIRVYATDEGATQRRTWFGGVITNYDCNNEKHVYIQLESDAPSYVPGDTAQIFIPNPYGEPVTALITTERAGVMHYEQLMIEGDALSYEFRLTDADAPTVYVSVMLMRRIGTDNHDPDFVQSSIGLNVEPVARRLNVEVTPSSEIVAPGDPLTFDVHLTDSEGNPVQGEVGLALTDEAVLALRPPNSGTLESRFYGQQPLSVRGSSSISALLTLPDDQTSVGCGGGGGDERFPTDVREDFIYTPLWEPHVVTDESGHAAVTMTMPDNLTRWRVDARAVTMDTRVGQTTGNITSTLPLIVRPVAPRFFVAGDHLPLAAIVNNNTEAEQTIEVRLEAEGVRLDGADAAQTVTLRAGGHARVEWPVIVEAVDGVDMTVYASGGGYQDAARPALRTGPHDTIPVYRYVASDTASTGGVLREEGETVESVVLPTDVNGDIGGALTVEVSPSLAAVAIDSFDYLRDYPHECIEQTVSRFLPNAVTYRALRDLGVDDPELKANLDTVIEGGLTRLAANQNGDGGWGWFERMNSDPLVTAYALLGLIEAEQAGYTVELDMTERAAAFVDSALVNAITVNTPVWRLNRQAFLLYVLTRWQQREASESDALIHDANALYESRLELSYAGRAYLLMAFTELAPESDAVSGLTSDLISGAIVSANGAHWEEANLNGWNWDSDTRTTAIALAALVRAEPDNPLLPNVVRWLMVARRGDHWTSTQETAWAAMALTDWMVVTGELEANYAFAVDLNGTAVMEGQTAPDTVRDSQSVQIGIENLEGDSSNQLMMRRDEGSGSLYYTASLQLELPAAQAEAVSRGITVEREYYTHPELGRTTDHATLGKIVTIRLNITLSQDIYFFALEDTLPAGLEILDTRLLTTTQDAGSPTLHPVRDDEPYWYWGYWLFDQTVLRDQGAALYADFLPRGSYIFTYQARAVTPGEFQVIPAQAFAFYQPEVYGHTEGTVFSITQVGHP